jgi:hypothetical protein
MSIEKKVSKVLLSSAFHNITTAQLSDFFVTDSCKFSDDRWYLPNPTPGATKTKSTIEWRMYLFDGSRLTDEQNAPYLQWCRKLVATLIFAPADGIPMSPGSLGGIQVSVKWLVSWMIQNAYRLPHELTPKAVAQYISDLPGMIIEKQDDETISESTVYRALNLLLQLWRQRHVLENLGIAPIPRDPFFVQGAKGIAQRIATKPGGWIKPLPDEVAIPLFNKAAWFLGTPADDILRLLEIVWDAKSGHEQTCRVGRGGQEKLQLPSQSKDARLLRQQAFLDDFSFGVPPGEPEPWHVPLDAYYELSAGQLRTYRVRQLFDAVRDACVITIQGTSGMRISELIGIKAGIDPATRLPSGVRVEDSVTGLYEWFIIRTDLSKTESTPRGVDWILGMRPKGSSEVPPAVHALEVLNKMYAPWRKSSKTNRLLLQANVGITLPLRDTVLGSIVSDKLRESMKRFIERWIDYSSLPDESAHKTEDQDLVRWRESKGSIFSSHMLRKSWANFTLAVDSRLLPAIQMQFHHLSLAMTEGGYIGRNPLLLEALDSMSRQQRNLTIYEMVTGKKMLAGRMGEQIEEATRGLRKEIKGLPTSQAWEKVITFCEENHLRIFFSPHGKCCPTQTTEMRCQNSAGVVEWLRQEPNYTNREPSLCAGCACFVLDARHQSFWEGRYLENWISYRRALTAGQSGHFRVVKERAEQAGKLLKKLGVDIKILDEKIDRELKVEHAAH